MKKVGTKNKEDIKDIDVLIAGGGIAGLTAALYYSDRYPERRVVVVEASDRWGGHLQTYYDKNYQYETGAGRFNTTHRHWIQLSKRLGLHSGPIRSKKHACDGETPPLPTGKPRAPETILRSLTFGDYLDRYYSPEERRRLQIGFGYDAEFDLLNAADALTLFQTDFQDSIDYFYVQEGFSEGIRRLVQHLRTRPNVQCYLKTPLLACHRARGAKEGYLLQTETTTYWSPHVFLALPKEALLRLRCPLLTPLRPLLNQVAAVPLHRIYGMFTPESPYPEHRMTTHRSIRQYIPIRPDLRLSMVSYSDARVATDWHRRFQRDPVATQARLEKQLTQTVRDCARWTSRPNTKLSDAPLQLAWVRSHYWSAGVHVWKAGAHSGRLSAQLRQPAPNLFIVGEAYSTHQGWVEGALSTVADVFEKYLW